MKPGDTFQIKKDVNTKNSLYDLGFEFSVIEWLVTQELVCEYYELNSYSQKFCIGFQCFHPDYCGNITEVTEDLIIPPVPKPYNHPLTKIFK